MAKRTIKQNEARRALWDKWQRLRATTEDALKLRIYEIFEGLKTVVCDQLEADAARFARLADKDEAIYTHLTKMMGMYRDVIALAEQAVSESPAAVPLLNGICEVLNSRLEEQTALQATPPENTDDTSYENPVTQEKRVIIEKATLYAAREAENVAVQFVRHMQEDLPGEWAALCAGAGAATIEDTVAKECFQMIYTHYQEALRFCLAGLDDLHARKTARFYTELIEREWEELGNIITVQVLHLEAAVSGVEVDKVPTIHRILDILRELYQHTGPLIEALQKLLHTPPTKAEPCRSFGEFTDALAETIVVESDSTGDSGAFLEALSTEANSLFNQLRTDFMKATYQLQRIISGELLLAEEIQSAFAKTKTALTEMELDEPPAELDEKEAQIQRDILKGISETIEIKIESLTDSFEDFNKKGLAIIRDFTAEKPDIPPDERQQSIEKVHAAWMAEPPADYAQLSAFFQKCWDSEAFQTCRERIARQITTYYEKTEKSAFMYKKEVVLYEICTYEEILTHSVSRLRESAWTTISEAAALLDSAFKDLEVLLKKNNITVIRPAPHDAFNAQEHEVLVAEKQDGFNKGEIIKIINSGYRQKEQIILRANVIAAR